MQFRPVSDPRQAWATGVRVDSAKLPELVGVAGPAFGASIAHGVNDSTGNLAPSLGYAGPPDTMHLSG